MPTVVLRPTSTTSATGWPSNPIVAASDDDETTSIIQNQVSCDWTAVLEDLDSGLSGATINSFTISAIAKGGRAGAASADLSLLHSTDGIFATETESWGGSKTTQTTSSRTTQQDGSSALTFAYINNCSVKIDPNNQGITLFELFVTIDYTAAAAGATVHSVNTVAEANIAAIKGVAHANIAEVNTVTFD